MELIGPVLLVVVGVAFLCAAGAIGKKKRTAKPLSQRRAEVFSDYDRQMDQFRR